uniref:Unkown protein n=1 Tax=Riptortus pedestris TaxID=329032 RepID=R4WR78_RIPPE|nr:unkown protein [Riptortus pedestris]
MAETIIVVFCKCIVAHFIYGNIVEIHYCSFNCLTNINSDNVLLKYLEMSYSFVFYKRNYLIKIKRILGL